MYCYDVNPSPNIDRMTECAKQMGVNFNFIIGSTMDVVIPECDLLFIDTIHTYGHVKYELEFHADKVKKYIVFHDTDLFGHVEESWGVDAFKSSMNRVAENHPQGIVPAINEFLDNHPEWRVIYHSKESSGLSIIERNQYPHIRLP